MQPRRRPRLEARRDPDLAGAAVDLRLRPLQRVVQRLHLLAELDDVAVAVLPVVEELEGLGDLLEGFRGPVGGGHGALPVLPTRRGSGGAPGPQGAATPLPFARRSALSRACRNEPGDSPMPHRADLLSRALAAAALAALAGCSTVSDAAPGWSSKRSRPAARRSRSPRPASPRPRSSAAPWPPSTGSNSASPGTAAS